LSTEALPPEYDDNPGPPRRRRRWRRIVLWTAASLVIFILAALIGLVSLIRNPAFRQYVLSVVHSRLSKATGIQLRIRDFSVRLSGISPTVDMYGVVIDGAPPYQRQPLLQADHLGVSVQVVSLLQRKWYLKDVAADRPVLRVIVGPNGETNLPKPKTAPSQTSVFDLGIRHFTINHGELFYNDRQSAVDADVHELEFQSTFDPGPKRYSSGLSYTDGRIRLQNFEPIVHSLEAQFDATADTLTLKRAFLRSGTSELSVAGILNDYAHPKVSVTYLLSVNTGELRAVLKEPTLPAGVVRLKGSLQFESSPGRPVLDSLILEGNLSSSGLQIHTATIHTLVRDISGRYAFTGGNFELQNLGAVVLGGRINGSFAMRDVMGEQIAQVHATLQNIPLAGIQALVHPQGMQQFGVTGTADAKVDASWRKTFDTLTAHTDASAQGTLYQHKTATPTAGASVPLNAAIHADYSAASQTVTFTETSLQSGRTRLDLNGTVSQTASLGVQLQSSDLSEIELFAGALGALPRPLGLGGMVSFYGTVRGSTAEPQIAGQFASPTLSVKATQWRGIRAGVQADPSRFVVRNGEVTPANKRGRITFSADVGLDRWSFRDTSPFQLDITASQLSVANIKSLAGAEAPVTGTLAAHISLHGTELSPEGRATVNLTDATVGDEPVQAAVVEVVGTGDELRGRLGLRLAAGAVQSTFTFLPKQKAYNGELEVPALRLEELRALRARNVNVAGTVHLTAKGSGTVDNPGLHLSAEIPQLQIQDQTISGIALQANVADRQAEFALDSKSQALNTFVRGRGRINLTGAYDAEVTFDTSTISLEPLVALYLPAQSALKGRTEVHATVRGPLKDTARLEAHITIPTLSVAYGNDVQLSAAQPIRVDYGRGVVTLQKTEFHGTGTNLQLQGTIPVASTAPMLLVALGTIDLGIAQMFSPDLTSSGQLEINIGGTGRISNPNVQGQIKVVNASFAGDGLPIGLQNGNGVLTLTSTRVEIDKFEGKVSGGTLIATGGITYRPSVQFNLAVVGTGIRTLYPSGVREGIDTNLTVTGSLQSALVRGQLRLTELSFSPAFDITDVISTVGSGGPGTTVPPGGFARNVNLDVQVVSTSDLTLASSRLSLQGSANLRVRGTAAQPAVTGRVNVTGGDLIFRGNRYVVENGTLDFVDPYRIDPRMNLSVSTEVSDYNIRMLFRGTLDRIRTTYTSEPPLPPSDIINLLVFGKTSQAQAQTATPTFGTLGAESMIASSVSNQVTSRLEKIAGISQLSVDPILGGASRDPSARITIQQRITADLFVTYATDATSTQRQVIKVDYQYTPRVAISGTRDQNGGFAFDVRIRKSW
jgi:translocation and assembly module TamB